jgi:cell division protein FtsQ
MDGRGRIAQPQSARPRLGAPRLSVGSVVPVRVVRFVRRYLGPVAGWRAPRGVGIAASMVLVLGSIAYGTVKGDHVAALVGELKNARDAAANAAGFRVAEVAIAGRRLLTDQEVLAAAGVTRETTLLFLDAAEARTRITASPWIAEATVRKLYPGRLEIEITERVPFALWQTDGKINIISADGTVLAPLTDRRFVALPLVVGRGAEKKARGFLAILDRHPAIRTEVRAAILVGERRWNLKLKNGVDVRLPELNPEGGLATLARLARDRQLLTRDITAVDLRLPDRVSVRLSEDAARAREDATKVKKGKRKGGDA